MTLGGPKAAQIAIQGSQQTSETPKHVVHPRLTNMTREICR